MIKTGTPNAFSRTPAISKATFDSMQGMHPKILVCTLPLTTSGKDTYRRFFDRILDIMVLCEDKTPLYLKIHAWHTNNKRLGVSAGPPRIENFKEMLMLRQHLMKAIDPDCIKSIGYVLDQLTPVAKQYEQYVLNDEYEQILDFNEELDAYESFLLVTREAS